MNEDLPPRLVRFGAELEDAIRRELGASYQSRARRFSNRSRARPTILSVSVAVIAGAVVLLTMLLGATTSPPPAYAVTRNQNGTITLTLRDLATAIPALNAKLASLGVDDTVVPISSGCKTSGLLLVSPDSTLNASLTLTAGRRYLLPGWRGVLAAKQLPYGRVGLIVGAVTGPVPSCFASRVASKGGPVLGYRNGAYAAGDHAGSASSPSAITRETLLLAKQEEKMMSVFRTSHVGAPPRP